MRLAELYLLYAEALYESQGPGPEVNKSVDLVRERAGLEPVATAWSTYYTNPGQPGSQTGMRENIHQERMLEMVFEGKRFWDFRRWNTPAAIMHNHIRAGGTNKTGQ